MKVIKPNKTYLLHNTNGNYLGELTSSEGMCSRMLERYLKLRYNLGRGSVKITVKR